MASGSYRPRIKVEIDTSALRRLRTQPEAVLRDLDRPVLDAAQRGMDQAQFDVPRGGAPNDPVKLADTAYVALPVHTERLSTVCLAGYRHPHAGAIHAGWHFGKKTKPPPEWLRNAFKRGVRGLLKQGIAAQLPRTLAKLFPPK